MTTHIARQLLAFALCAGGAVSTLPAQVSIISGKASSPAEISVSEVYAQNFDSLPTAAATKPDKAGALDWKNNETLPGWFRDVASSKGDFSGSGAYVDAPVFFNYGMDGQGNRSVGFRSTQGLYRDAAVAVVFQNKTETPIKGVKVAYTGRQWRRQSEAASTLVVGWRWLGFTFDAGTFAPRAKQFWTDAPDSLIFTAPRTSGANVHNGTAPQCMREFAPVEIVFDRPVPRGASFAIRWYYPTHAKSTGNALAVDDVKIEFIR
ncbi:hypothetical protein OH491_02905 [Termitidicoccus mucosus]